MSRIAVLPSAVADQIAAGEVVERPASAVKELAENALDAGAVRIRIDLEQGGKTLIEVSDDGHGMGREDAVLALDRHATSKIRSATDLVGVRTFGLGSLFAALVIPIALRYPVDQAFMTKVKAALALILGDDLGGGLVVIVGADVVAHARAPRLTLPFRPSDFVGIALEA